MSDLMDYTNSMESLPNFVQVLLTIEDFFDLLGDRVLIYGVRIRGRLIGS